MGDDVPLAALFALLVLLLLLSAFFSGSETALMSLSRYRLRHQARAGRGGARRAEWLLERPDQLVGLARFGSHLVNFSAAAVVAVIALELGGPPAVAAGTFLLSLVVLVVCDNAARTLGAVRPERLGLLASHAWWLALRLLYPVVWLVNACSNALLRLFGIDPQELETHSSSHEALRAVVFEAGARISHKHRRMLLGILDLESVTVDDVMVPHNEIVGIDLEDDLEEIIEVIRSSGHTRLPVFRDTIDNVIGILHLRHLANRVLDTSFGKEDIERLLEEPYFVPEGTPLSTQLVQFQRSRQRLALVVDEYGDIQGLLTLEDLLEEIVGEFSTAPAPDDQEIVRESDETFLVKGTANIREMNRLMNWSLPTDGPKTLNGLILEYLETIPESGTGLKIDGYPIEILETNGNRVRTARIYSRRRESPATVE
ncbi:MAG TPA: CNNM domain-containing protein [Woeseiaceae bacterium]|nr:CNNM domain-containing protein [Woeseiaceae bacterium]